MSRCTPIACNNPTPQGGLCADCLRYVAELELGLWGQPVGSTADIGIPFWIKKKLPGLDVGGGGEAEQKADECQVIHDCTRGVVG
jgi:hypothetical protein